MESDRTPRAPLSLYGLELKLRTLNFIQWLGFATFFIMAIYLVYLAVSHPRMTNIQFLLEHVGLYLLCTLLGGITQVATSYYNRTYAYKDFILKQKQYRE